MNETGKKKEGLLILGLLALIAALFLGIQMIFGFLGRAIPNQGPAESMSSVSTSQSEQAAAPSYCPFCGERLPESFRWGRFCPYCGEKVEERNT